MLSVFVLLLAGFAHGASVNAKLAKCGYFNIRNDIQCGQDIINFSLKGVSIFWKNPAEIQKFQQACDNLQSCYASLACRDEDWHINQVTQNIQAYCNSMVYLTTDFSGCMQKLNSRNSQCWMNYVPVNGDFCSNVFGYNYCVRSEIIGVCGQQEWIGFRDNMINLLSVVSPNCNLDQLRNL
ncbi:hypothetical protein L5515_006066 [Caenorhabditis briggsae]|uniref:T20D4.11-like domain-containing protein n=1 Tax=Caenorhabditis briggsae TaxID=6238 RepID=A0AAE9JJ19_CAEBR|nr:hypothetical protein L5515_006066 [Caenorhabditis briggsae]